MAKLLTAAQAADICAVKKETLLEWIKAGKLTAVKFDKSYRIDEADLMAFIDEKKTTREANARKYRYKKEG